MASGNIPPPYRELAHTVNDGLEVILSWQKLTDELTITVSDERGGAYFELVAAPDEAPTGWGDDPMSGHAELCDVEGKLNPNGVAMSEHLNASGGVAERESLPTSVEIEVQNRWDALALSETLIPYHSFLVEFDCQRWVVHARVPGNHGEPLDGALGKIKEWLVDRRLEDVACRVGGQPYELNERRAA